MKTIDTATDLCTRLARRMRRVAGAAADAGRQATAATLDWSMPRACVLCDATAGDDRDEREGRGERDGRDVRHGRGDREDRLDRVDRDDRADRDHRGGHDDRDVRDYRRRVDVGAMLCAACRHDAMASMADACERCALPLRSASVSRVCGRCLRRPAAFDRTCAAAAYTAPFEQLVRGLKYGATLAYAPLLADLLDERARRMCLDALPAIDVIVPVPLSRDRMASRGFNQAIEIGRVVAGRWGCPLDTTGVLRIVDTKPQAGLRLDARRRNVRGAFAVTDRGRSRLAGRRVAVIDDVMTTGATLDEFARTLKRAGVAHVDNLVVARRR